MADQGIFSSSFDCESKKWSTPELVGLIPEPEVGSGEDNPETNTPGGINSDWQINDTAGTATLTMRCNGDCSSECNIPSPPDRLPGFHCKECFCKFKKRYDCATNSWLPLSAGAICLPPSDGESDWGPTEDPCIWEKKVATNQWCLDESCPTPGPEAAPAGPFVVPEGCCPPPDNSGLNSSAACVPCVGDCRFLGCSVV